MPFYFFVWTPEQQDEVRKAKAVGDNRVTIGFTA